MKTIHVQRIYKSIMEVDVEDFEVVNENKPDNE